MGVSYYGYAIIGVKIDPKKLVKIETVRGCDCKESPTGNFCTDCGSKTFVEKEYDFDEEELIGGYKVIFGTDREKAFLVAISSEVSGYKDDNGFSQIPDNIKEIKTKMRNTLGPMGLWDEKSFGLWSVLYCSY